jgi:hypothetical protein
MLPSSRWCILISPFLFNMIGIYKITSPSGKVYIGQAVDIERRKKEYTGLHCKNQTKLHNSLVKYGFSEHIFEVLEECNIEELNIRERHWQDYYEVLETGLNLRLTGTGNISGRQAKDTIEKRAAKKRKSVAQYTVEGTLVREWSSGNEASKFLNISGGDISMCCKGKLKSSGGFIWIHKVGETQAKISVGNVNNEKPILQFSKEKVLIREWKSAKEASEILQIDRGNISACCKGRYKSAGGFFWKYKKKELEH